MKVLCTTGLIMPSLKMHLLEFPSSISETFLSGFIFGNVSKERLLPVKS